MYQNEVAVPLPRESSEEENSEEKTVYIAYIILLSIMLIYVTVGTWMERRKCAFGHETGVVILLGIGIGGIL